MLSSLGVIILLFQVGLESTVAQMMKVGVSSFTVATVGVIGPFVLGWGVGAWLLPQASMYAHIFLGATLTATSVGITARVLKDLGRSQTDEARIILGAAVIDDVQGLVDPGGRDRDHRRGESGRSPVVRGDRRRARSRRPAVPRRRARAGRLRVAASLLARLEAGGQRRPARRRAGVLLFAGLARRLHRAGADCRRLRGRPRARGRALPRLRQSRRTLARAAHRADRVVPRPDLLRRHGRAHRSSGVRAAWRAGPRGCAHRRGHCRQADVHAGRDGTRGSTVCRSASA